MVIGLALCTQTKTRARPLFEPTDLELEDPGWVEFDFQLGTMRGRDPWRVVVPDFELNVGMLPNFELDLDGSYSLEGSSNSPFSHPHATPDALWASAKVGLKDWHDEQLGRTWALGVQVGPKLPIARESHGAGVEGLFLLGAILFNTNFVINAGLINDPRPTRLDSRPFGFECGLDIHAPFDKNDTVAFIGEISGVHFFSAYPHQLSTTAGLTYSPYRYLDLSAIALAGWLNGSDRYGLLLGLAPKFRWLSS